jgi:hypothetical protein
MDMQIALQLLHEIGSSVGNFRKLPEQDHETELR